MQNRVLNKTEHQEHSRSQIRWNTQLTEYTTGRQIIHVHHSGEKSRILAGGGLKLKSPRCTTAGDGASLDLSCTTGLSQGVIVD